MKKCISLLLIFALVCGLFAGCANKTDNSAYVPTGDAILLEGQEPEDIMPEEEEEVEILAAEAEMSEEAEEE